MAPHALARSPDMIKSSRTRSVPFVFSWWQTYEKNRRMKDILERYFFLFVLAMVRTEQINDDVSPSDNVDKFCADARAAFSFGANQFGTALRKSFPT